MELKEVSTKSGKTIVFCNFEELLKEAYNVKSMEEVKPYLTDNDEYIIHCPFCKAEGHTKHKLYIKGDLTTGHCFVCCRAYVNVTDEIDVSYTVTENLLNFGMQDNGFNLVKLEDPDWSIDRFKYEFDDFDQEGYDYLLTRHQYMSELYKVLNFRFIDGNAVIPFMKNGEVFYYQIKFSTPSSKIKYFLPRIEKKPPYIIERGEDCRHRLLIVEGVFDAIAALLQAPDYTPVAVLGSSITDYQINFIKDYSGYVDEIKIWMDETSISKKIESKLKTKIEYCPIEIIKSFGPDPEEVMKERMKQHRPLQWIKSKYKKE